MKVPAPAALWCKSNFSFLEGGSHPQELMEQAAALGIPALALTDRDGVYGLVEAAVRGRELGVKLICGSEISMEDGSTLVLLARSKEGYSKLCSLITRSKNPDALPSLRGGAGGESKEWGKVEARVGWQELYAHAGDLICLWGGDSSLLVTGDEAGALARGRELQEAFGPRLYAMVARHLRDSEQAQEARLRRRAQVLGIKAVAAVEVLYHHPKRRALQDALTCLRRGLRLDEAGDALKPNDRHALLSARACSSRYGDDPGALVASLEIAAQCTFSLFELGSAYRYPSEYIPKGEDTDSWLRSLTEQGARRRYKGVIPRSVQAQLDKELGLIQELQYGGYFLTLWEIVQFCRRKGILCQGRGSAANSAVCYCLHITAVDPVRLGFLFERFLSRERAEPPDIDLDIEHARREEVLQHVYLRYGRSHAAMVANVIRYRTPSAIREVGKVLGLAETTLDQLSRLARRDGLSPQTLEIAGLDVEGPRTQLFLDLVEGIKTFPRHLSIHPGGFLLGHEPVHDLVPIERASMENRTVIQWDKYAIEELGLFKVDLLGLGALNHLHGAFDLLKKHRRLELSMATIPADDARTFEMISRGDTIGVFQIESRAQMAMLPRLRPQCFYDLVIEVSIVRPGPISGGMVHPYLARRAGDEPIVYPHACLKPVLAKTLGVPIFQEQVMRLAVVAADYSPGEADQLRRDMAAWRKEGRIEAHHERLVRRMTAKGIAPAFAERVFEQIRGFGEYGFPESHAASFALIAYATAWLRCHHKDVFTCALLNALPMGFYSVSTLVEDARRNRVPVRPNDVSASQWDCSLEPLLPERGNRSPLALRMGLRFIRGLGQEDGERILRQRARRPFRTLEDFVHRTRLNEGTLQSLARADALASFEPDRRSVIWQARGLARRKVFPLELDHREGEASFRALNPMEAIAWDQESSQHSTRGHPLKPLRPQLAALDLPTASELARLRDGQRTRYAGLVICRQRPGTASGVTFLTLEDETGFVNGVVWKQVAEGNTLLLKTATLLGVEGRIQSKEGVVHLIAQSFFEPEVELDVRLPSRDYR